MPTSKQDHDRERFFTCPLYIPIRESPSIIEPDGEDCRDADENEETPSNSSVYCHVQPPPIQMILMSRSLPLLQKNMSVDMESTTMT